MREGDARAMPATVVVLGLPGVGKSTRLYQMKQRFPGFRQFSVRLFTLQLLEGDTELGRYLRENDVVKPKAYMPDPVVERIFAAFLAETPPEDFVVIEGFPINAEQYRGMIRQLEKAGRALDAVFVFEDDMERIRSRLEGRRVCPACELKNGAGLPVDAGAQRCPYCGGELVRRADDDPAFFAQRCANFWEELDFFYRMVPAGKIHRIDVSRQDALQVIEDWRRANAHG